MKRFLFFIAICSVFAPVRAQSSLPENEHDCFILPTSVAEVGSPVRGVVERVLVKRGDPVTQGQPIAELESGNEQIMVMHATARADMKSEVAARETELALAALELDRIEDMHRQNVVSTQQRDEAEVRKQIAQSALERAIENRKLLQIELQQATHELAQRTLRSPTDGFVIDQFIVPGEFIYDEPIMSIAALNPLYVEVVLPASLFGSVPLDSEAMIFPELDQDNPLAAIVDAVDVLLDTRSGTFGVRLMLPNADLAVTAGQKCTVDFVSGDAAVELAEEAN